MTIKQINFLSHVEGGSIVNPLFKGWEQKAVQVLDRTLADTLPGVKSESTLPVIIEMTPNAKEEERQEIKQLCQQRKRDEIVNELKYIPMVTATICQDTLREAAHHPGVKRIFYDQQVRAYLDVAVPTVTADEAHARWGLTGKGITVAVLDTGIEAHDDLTKPENRLAGFNDLVGNETESYDDNGHGTHVAGIIAGNGYRSDGKYVGSAPEANLVGVKVLDNRGSGQVSTIMRGIDWCIQEKEQYNIRVINLSLGGPATEPYTDDPLSRMVEQAWHNGIVVCAAAGNEGPEPGTIGTPGFHPSIVTVGATYDQNTETTEDDKESEFSSRGPTVDHLNKPDVLAPGEKIVSLLAENSPLNRRIERGDLSSPLDGYVELSGTSMATPLCAGVAALLIQHNESLSPNDVKSILVSSSTHLKGSQPGYVNVVSALKLAEVYLEYGSHDVYSS